jgi:hypothetical protein
MASSYTTRIKLEQQADGENPNSWGDILNNNVIQLVDDAIAAYTSVTLSSVDYSLTVNSGATDQSRSAMLEIVGTVSSSLNIIIPGVSKFYFVKDKSIRQNDSTITMKTAAGTGLLIGSSATKAVMCDSISVYETDGISQTICATDIFTTNINVATCLSATNIVAATGSFTTKVSGVAAEFSGAVCVGTSIFGVGAVFTGTVSAAFFDGDGSNLTNLPESSSTLPRSYLAGLVLSNNSSDSDADIDIAVGECKASSTDISLASALTKKIDATWAAGNGAGGMAGGITVAANTWYHVHAITVGGADDVGFDTSPIAANLISSDSATAYRRIGSIYTDGSSDIRDFKQTGDKFLYDQPILSHPSINIGSTARTTISLNTPVSVSTEAIYSHLNFGFFAEALYAARPLSMTDVSIVDNGTQTAPTSAAMGTLADYGSGYVEYGDNARQRDFTWQFVCETNLNSQIGVRTHVTGGSADGSPENSFQTTGWYDTRGRED